MGRVPDQEQPFELILSQRGVGEKDIGWILSKLDSQKYSLDKCHYMAQILIKDTETKASFIGVTSRSQNYFI